MQESKITTYCFIDASNLFYGGEKVLGWKIDYERLFQYISVKYNAKAIFYYAGVDTLDYNYDLNYKENFPINELKKFLYNKDLDEFKTEKSLNMVKFFLKLQKFGYKLRLKPIKTIRGQNGITTRKANCDVDLTFDVMRFANSMDQLLLLSGDGDFEILLDYFKDQGKTIRIIANSKNTARQIKRRFHSEFVDLESIKNVMIRK